MLLEFQWWLTMLLEFQWWLIYSIGLLSRITLPYIWLHLTGLVYMKAIKDSICQCKLPSNPNFRARDSAIVARFIHFGFWCMEIQQSYEIRLFFCTVLLNVVDNIPHLSYLKNKQLKNLKSMDSYFLWFIYHSWSQDSSTIWNKMLVFSYLWDVCYYASILESY